MKQTGEPPETTKTIRKREHTSILHVPVRGDQLRDLGLVARLNNKTTREYMRVLLDDVIARELPKGLKLPVVEGKPARKKVS